MLRNKDIEKAVSVRRWTQTAIDCYKRGCVCQGCFYKDFFKDSVQRCQMKSSVIELVRVLGKPNIDAQEAIKQTI